ncbi:hypothetical protein [Gemelliphila palaticanis]|uniref:Uncharacterized protein n=1 Tax=Gemelliphila palaticanis TaxID=81950 RepID=A0ABX2SZ46_9BACL|nr:hypothetical protein [Gemella palaticanis]MBF0715716.1 hypothetical protein [Gemella palaticanis]NYS47646.1 hypothetical protein [Gemella palaticanis]
MKNKFLKIIIPLSLIFGSLTSISSAKEISLNKWEPMSIAKTPNKTSYRLGDKLDLTGLKINFVRYIKVGNKVEEEIKQVTMLPNTIKNGWQLLDNNFIFNDIGNYNINIKLKLIDPKLQYDLMYPEKVEVDENNFIVNKKSILEDKEKYLNEEDIEKADVKNEISQEKETD